MNGPNDESLWWERFAAEFFDQDATLSICIREDKLNEFTIGRTLIPRFFRSYFDGGVTDLSIQLRNPKETSINPHLTTLDCDQAFIITNNMLRHPQIAQPNPSVVVHTEGQLRLEFVGGNNNMDALLIKTWRFYTRSCREYIDRSMAAIGMPPSFLVDPITRQGLTKSTISYLKMCMIMEPMQDLMFQNKQTKMDPRSCLKKLLLEKYKYRSGEDNRATANKKRRRKTSAAVTTIPGATTTNKKSKTNLNNLANNSGLNNSALMSPSGGLGFSPASDAVMVVGEPSMMGGDFGDDNERMITRLENTQYDPSASTPSNVEDSDSMTAPMGNDNVVNNSNGNSLDSTQETHTSPPSLLQPKQQQLLQHQQQQQALQPTAQETSQALNQVDLMKHENQDIGLDQQDQQELQMNMHNQTLDEQVQQQHVDIRGQMAHEPTREAMAGMQRHDSIDMKPEHQESSPQSHRLQYHQPSHHASSPNHQPTIKDEQDEHQQQQQEQQHHNQQREQSPLQQLMKQEQVEDILIANNISLQDLKDQEEIQLDRLQQEQPHDVCQNDTSGNNDAKQPQIQMVGEVKLNSMIEPTNQSGLLVTGENSAEQLDNNHVDSIPTLEDESNSNSQLPCSKSTTTTNPTMEQQQPVDNGVA